VRQEARLIADQDAGPNVSPRAEAVADIQTVQNLNRAPLVPATFGDRLLPASTGTIQVSGFMPSPSVAAEGTPNTQASATRASAPVVATGVAAPLVSTEGQVVTAPAVARAPAQEVVGTILSVDTPRSEVTIRDHFSGEDVTLVATPEELRDLERGIEVRALIAAGSNRATRIDIQTSR
ncbi:MAG TPA: hypothetical protein VL404_08790, partial [Candidatus Eisenbacteria bacterium]|nr:hypothetical protein [Candidatus Eisenbacteria bacterium]